ncbi:hypothetical protein [Dyella monticola]|uniref:hypothetical protein n=1 Tax=Dyella monticola TaxID=1927958 RepID=UPI001E28FF43|nr:hypothetical protein [Dyella monticola]
MTHSELTIDKQQVVYFSQQEACSLIAWPGDGLNGHTALTWQTLDAGVRQVLIAQVIGRSCPCSPR